MSSFFSELNKIEKGNLDPVYILIGDDFFLQQEILNALYNSFDTEDREIFYGKSSSASQDEIANRFLEELYSVGLFSSKKIVLFKDINKLKRQYHKRLLSYFSSIDENILLILTADNKRSGFVKKLIKKATDIMVYTPFPNKYANFVSKFIKRKGYRIEPEAQEILISETDDSLSHTFSELEKVFVSLNKGDLITTEHIKKIIGGEKKYQMYDFLDAVGNKNPYQAINICMTLIKNGASIPFFATTLYNRFLDIWAYHQIHHPDKHKKPYFIRKKLNKLQKAYNIYKNADFGYIFCKIREADLKGKSTSLKTEDVIIPLIIKIMGSTD